MDGIIIIDKPKGYTSHDIVYKVRKKTNEKVGHTGTLDPMATGVLPLLIGKATLCSKYIINHDKVYQVQMQLGKKTDTADSEGTIIKEEIIKNEILQEDKIKNILQKFIGKQEQKPPMYSAIKVNGKKLYEYARKGETVEVKPRKIEIYSIKLTNINLKEKQIDFIVSCSKGTYIRSLCEDIAEKMGTIAYMSKLKRLQVGDFSINNAISIDIIEKDVNYWNIITIEEFFKNKQTIELEKNKLTLFLNGVQLTRNENDGIYRIYSNQQFIGIGKIGNKLLKRDIIL